MAAAAVQHRPINPQGNFGLQPGAGKRLPSKPRLDGQQKSSTRSQGNSNRPTPNKATPTASSKPGAPSKGGPNQTQSKTKSSQASGQASSASGASSRPRRNPNETKEEREARRAERRKRREQRKLVEQGSAEPKTDKTQASQHQTDQTPIGITGSKTLTATQNQATRQVSADVKFSNRTQKSVIYKVKCNNPKFFSIYPLASGVLDPSKESSLTIYLHPGYDKNETYKVLIQAAYLSPDDLLKYNSNTASGQPVTPEDLWQKIVVDEQRNVINAKMLLNINEEMPQNETAEGLLQVVEQWLGGEGSSRAAQKSGTSSKSKKRSAKKAQASSKVILALKIVIALSLMAAFYYMYRAYGLKARSAAAAKLAATRAAMARRVGK